MKSSKTLLFLVFKKVEGRGYSKNIKVIKSANIANKQTCDFL